MNRIISVVRLTDDSFDVFFDTEEGQRLVCQVYNTNEPQYFTFDEVVEASRTLLNAPIINQLTIEEIKQGQIVTIKRTLSELDKIISRSVEDLYACTGCIPYENVAAIIRQKDQLRQELRDLIPNIEGG